MKNELNSKQQSAVVTIEGPLLIIAGAGSGKTRTLIERIANIILSKRAFPSEIMAVTFTNKAAKELKERIVYRVGEIGKAVFAGTFHSISARILRKYADRLGYNSNFVIYDTEDKEKVVKGMIKKNNFNNSSFPHKKISTLISILKNKLIYPENYNSDTDEYFYDKIKDIYSDYQRELEKCNAFDFDDLICMTVKLFQKNEDVLFEYQNRIKYICVDEYQDTNFVQDEFVTLLSKIYKNVCVVGDEDQSIYSWRGADINNILTFKDRHKNCAMIQLEQNYRSSANILKTANSIISKNIQRLGKNLFTESDSGEKIKLISCLSDIKEGNIVIDEIVNTVNEGSELNEICVLYRTNSQSRIIEENLRKKGLPYSIFGGLKFYERKEIKDITAYLRLLINSDDNVSFERILNFPPRGIDKKTLEKIKSKAIQTGLSYFQVLKSSDIFHSDSKSNNKISEFIELIETTAIEMIKFNAQKTAEFI
ncbi:MAG: UvrD-helicase domain-containing protein, partial [Candidatus Delongbacteria bacterium]|nr:UvrD-helicase domain-containing protein [Candidatus Delongbacteria bacterium]